MTPTLKTALTATLKPALAPLALALLLAAAVPATSAHAGALENMERERAILISTLLDPAVSTEDRAHEAEVTRRRLIDLEAMTMRDPKVRDDRRPIARRAFQDYDLTFLGHASIERQMTPMDLWMDRIGLSSARVLSARVGRR
jgi:hypothetical protein